MGASLGFTPDEKKPRQWRGLRGSSQLMKSDLEHVLGTQADGVAAVIIVAGSEAAILQFDGV